jgi:hypothetical protein
LKRPSLGAIDAPRSLRAVLQFKAEKMMRRAIEGDEEWVAF